MTPRAVMGLAVAVLLVGGGPAAAEPPTLLRDINQLARGYSVQESITIGGRVLLSISGPETGFELAIVNAFSGALESVDLEPGPMSSFPSDFLRLDAGRVLFTASTSAHGRELWVSNGTASGTTELEINMGPVGSVGFGLLASRSLVRISDGRALVGASDGVHGTELWFTDGTPEGTILFDDIFPDEVSSNPREIILIPGGFLMSATSPGAGTETFFLKPFVSSGAIDLATPLGASNPSEFTLLANPANAVFTATVGGLDNSELWVTDEATAAGSMVVKDIVPGPGGSHPMDLRLVNGVVIFDAETPGSGRELWRTDGTLMGTVPIEDLYPGPHRGLLTFPPGVPVGSTRFVYPAVFPDAGTELAVTDGFSITRLADVMPGAASGWVRSGFSQIVATATKAYAGLDDGVHGLELWETDGTPGGTSLVTDLLPGPGSSLARPLAVDGETLYFLANGPNGFGLWQRRNGPPSLVRDLSAGGTDDARISFDTATAGDRVFFGAFDAEAGQALWTTDGTPGGTQRLVDFVPGVGGDVLGNFLTLGHRVFFSGADEAHGRELFVSDGTAAGTHIVKDLVPGEADSDPLPLVGFGGRLLFTTTVDRRLWISDGTEPGTTLLEDFDPALVDSYPTSAVVLGDRVLFLAPSNGDRLWTTDGTPGGARLVSPDVRAFGGPFNKTLTPFGSTAVLFRGFDITGGSELWIYDGATADLHRVADLVPGNGDSDPSLITVAGNRAFFIAVTAAGVGLWVTDGTKTGTTPVTAPVAAAMADADTLEMVALGERVVFTAETGGGRALWISDGTPTGTQQLGAVCAGGRQCGPRSLFAFDGAVFFNFDDGVHGFQLWQTDGTPAGTRMVADLAPGAASFTYRPSTVSFLGGKIFFAGCEDMHGCEPWIFDYDQCPDDPAKLTPGTCGCGVADTDADGNGVPDCVDVPDQCPDDSAKRAPGACGCGVPDVDADGSGVPDCLVADELRARIDALSALIEGVTRPRSKAERRALKDRLAAIRSALDAVLAYHDAHAGNFPGLTSRLRTVKKAVKRLTHSRRAVKGPRAKALSALSGLRERIVS